MKVHCNIHYPTVWGEAIYVVGSCPELGIWDPAKAVRMKYFPGDEWKTEVIFHGLNGLEFEYKYILKNEDGRIDWEAGSNRAFFAQDRDEIDLRDSWCNISDHDGVFLTSAFCDVIFGRNDKKAAAAAGKQKPSFRLQIAAPRIDPGHTLCVSGSIPALGKWSLPKAVAMDPGRFPLWTLELELHSRDIPFTYKYCIKDSKGRVVYTDERFRNVGVDIPEKHPAKKSSRRAHSDIYTIVTDEPIRYPENWRGAGLAVPVFSLRTKDGLGVGEFSDLKLLADWASRARLRLIQLLPVNDTSATMTWTDSYPYANISVFALHPIYLNIEALGAIPEDLAKEIAVKKKALNGYDHVNYEEVMAAKTYFAREIFQREKKSLFASPEFKKFFKDNSFWLEPYAAFCSQRDTYKTSDPGKWERYSKVTADDVSAIVSAGSENYDAVAFYYFLQYHLHTQLSDAARYVGSKGVILKGDIPIGIHKHSDSCWIRPDFFNMNQSAGAPPDPFSETGQNWGFPTYNWAAMSRDGYGWWRRRLLKMSDYFQMIRLDHVLGFFRIWEIPDTMISGLMGHFNPAIPLWRDELEKEGIWDFNRLCEAYIPLWLVRIIFGRETNNVISSYLEPTTPGHYRLRSEFDTQKKISENSTFPADAPEEAKRRNAAIKTGLSYLVLNVVLFRDADRPGFHPRINMMDTPSFDCLDVWMKEKLIAFYNDYFYKRQDDFWRSQAMNKIPVLMSASPMLIAGEDLGMIPDCVGPVMEDLGMLGLRIQRMPKEPDVEFSDPASYPYLTVCTTSSHDMSTIRGWWGEDYPRTQRYYKTILQKKGDAPSAASSGIVEAIIGQHLQSPSMWAIFPIQDLLAMSDDLKRPGDPREEQINDPANPNHYWKFRLHITLEKLLTEKDFSSHIEKIVITAGRSNTLSKD
ncbi:MAG: 4-alpha-glucanotransferase [Candidatus Omnitrophica bacterium]|nr:4-alpha-glucanotransferase [Candidatus Omnitrophota bacterium]